MDEAKTYHGYQKEPDKPSVHGSYGSALFDPRWKAARERILARDKQRCLNCGSTENLQIHHRQYHFSKSLNDFVRPWEYNQKYLITLCESCHSKGHRLYRVPVKTVK
ncbi:MAG TPA: HNH endonuclease [Bacteroidales bacterium]|nr:HNH endonuclease [Bacteroidales bacterium]